MKRLVLLLLAAAVFAPGTARATVPCRDRIYNDWYADGKIATSYPIACYRDAVKHVPADAREYSSLADDIRSALQGALARLHGHTKVPAQIGKGTTTAPAGPGGGPSSGEGSQTTATKTAQGAPPSAPSQQVSDTLPTVTTAAADSGGGSGVPVPLLVLGGLALLLTAVGAVGLVAKRRRS